MRARWAIVIFLVAFSSAAGQQPKDEVHSGPAALAPARRASDPQHYRAVQTVTRPGSQPVPIRNLIDRYVFGKLAADKIPHAGLSGDEEFLRRIYLDLTGRLPEPSDIRKFLADTRPGKRERVIDALMAIPEPTENEKPSSAFLSRWVYFFGDLLQMSNNHMAQGRNMFHDYLYLALVQNVPYDEMVRDMLTHTARSSWLDGTINFLAADHVNDSDPLQINQEDTYDAIAITTGKVFLGINLECVSCHDGRGHLEKINLGLSHISRDQFWRQGAFFSKLRMVRVYHDMNEEFSMLENGRGYDVTSDWNKKIVNTPSGRFFQYLEPTSGTAFLDPGEISVLFA
ncbi:MAG TPA: DUF1549 domain-containing protein [Bryobacteraceae bacterium]|nr:DUF1549 domain-containing protein [Bryobacteraceae bacterium]